MCHSASCYSLPERLTGPSHNLKLNFRLAAFHQEYNRYFYILKRDAAGSVTRFTDLGFRYVIALSQEAAADILKRGYGRGVSNKLRFTLVSGSESDILKEMRDFVWLLPIWNRFRSIERGECGDIISEVWMRGESVVENSLISTVDLSACS